MHKRARWAHGVGVAMLAASAGLAACEGGCRGTGGSGGGTSAPSAQVASGAADASDASPTLRLYVVSDLAGALEPCGCTKDQLGGLDHAAAWMRAEKGHAPSAALLTAGPLFFMEPSLKPDHVDQDVAKAETIAKGLRSMGLVGFAPGINEWAAGAAPLARLVSESGATLLYANTSPAGQGGAPLEKWVVREVGGVKVGVIGVSAAASAPGAEADGGIGLRTEPAPDAIKAGLEALKKSGAQVFVALAAVGRGDAKRLADAVPGLTAIVVGSPGGSGDLNSPAPPAERLGEVLVLQTGNHLTSVGALDLFVRGGSFTFADATGLELGQKRDEMRRRVDELRVKIAAWQNDPAVKKEDVDARRAEVTKLEADLLALDAHPAPAQGSYFRYSVKEIRDNLGSDPAVKEAIAAYYKQVNDHNKVAFADRMPPAHTAAQPAYIGVNACTTCHKEARAVWDGTRHAHAYATLADQNKQFNLDCVSCHVTGYDEPGGSSVTHVERLQDVQCEVCHGPGSKHALDPKRVKPVVAKPKGDRCLACHHSPHVEGFDPEKKMADILGPGHGL